MNGQSSGPEDNFTSSKIPWQLLIPKMQRPTPKSNSLLMREVPPYILLLFPPQEVTNSLSPSSSPPPPQPLPSLTSPPCSPSNPPSHPPSPIPSHPPSPLPSPPPSPTPYPSLHLNLNPDLNPSSTPPPSCNNPECNGKAEVGSHISCNHCQMHYCSTQCHNSTENHPITPFPPPPSHPSPHTPLHPPSHPPHLPPPQAHLTTSLPTPPLTPLSLPLPQLSHCPSSHGPPSFQQTPPSLSLILELFENGSFEDIVLTVPHFRNLDHARTSSLQTCRARDLLGLGINHFFGGQQKN